MLGVLVTLGSRVPMGKLWISSLALPTSCPICLFTYSRVISTLASTSFEALLGTPLCGTGSPWHAGTPRGCRALENGAAAPDGPQPSPAPGIT